MSFWDPPAVFINEANSVSRGSDLSNVSLMPARLRAARTSPTFPLPTYVDLSERPFASASSSSSSSSPSSSSSAPSPSPSPPSPSPPPPSPPPPSPSPPSSSPPPSFFPRSLPLSEEDSNIMWLFGPTGLYSSTTSSTSSCVRVMSPTEKNDTPMPSIGRYSHK